MGGVLLSGRCLGLSSSSLGWCSESGIPNCFGPAGRFPVLAAGHPRVGGPASDREGSLSARRWKNILRTGVAVPARGAGGMGWWPGGHLGPRGLRCGQGYYGPGKDTDPEGLGPRQCWRLPVVDPTSRERWETLVLCDVLHLEKR